MGRLGLGLALNLPRGVLTPAQSLSRDIVAWWKMENVNDSAGTTNLTNTNAVTFTAGKINNAATFVSASSQQLFAASSSKIQTGGISWTVGGWFKVNSNGQFGLAGKWGVFTPEWYITYNFGSVSLETFSGSFPSTSVAGVSSAAWHFLVAWVDASLGQQFIQIDNGTTSAGVATTIVSGTENLKFSTNDAGFNYLDGQLDEWFFLPRLLTSTEKAYLYNGGAGVTWPLP